MIVFPLFATLVSLACALVIGRDALRRPKPDRIVWTIAFAVFAVAAGAEVVGSLADWTPALARVYYLSGAVLVVGYLALGELYLLAGSRISRIAPGVALLVTALAVTLVLDTPVDSALLAEEGWRALDAAAGLTALTISINTIGTVVLVAGALYSAWRFRRLGIQRYRMIGCVLIAAGTVMVALGGTLTRFGRHEYLYIAMSFGVATIFAGVLQTRRTDTARTPAVADQAVIASLQQTASGRQTATPQIRQATRPELVDQGEPGMTYLRDRLLPLPEAELVEQCAIWSVPPRPIEHFTRDEARLVWALRLRLPADSQGAFDALTPSAQLQIAELYFEVLLAPATPRQATIPQELTSLQRAR